MFWEEVYKSLDYLGALRCAISGIWITKQMTVIIMFHQWDNTARRYETLERFCYIFSDESVAYGQ